jgi:uncharacterized protein
VSTDPFALVDAEDVNGLRAALAADPSLADQRDDGGVSLLLRAAYRRRPELVDVVCSAGRPILGLACFFGHVDAARLLLDRGADPDVEATNGSGLRPIHGAVAARSAPIVALLLERGADRDFPQASGHTALDAARHHGDADIEALLLDR